MDLHLTDKGGSGSLYDLKMVVLSDHAIKRARQRCGISRKSVLQQADRAREEGLPRLRTVGALRKYLDYLYDQEGIHSNHSKLDFYIYGSFIWLFDDQTLVTVLTLPSWHQSSADDQRRKFRTETVLKSKE